MLLMFTSTTPASAGQSQTRVPQAKNIHVQVHGFPKVMGVLTHLDQFHNAEALKKTKKALKHRFWAEIYQGRPSEARLCALSTMSAT